MQGRAITSDQTERFLQGLRHGLSRRAAAGTAGFSKTTLYRMIDSDPDGTLVTAIEMAEAEAEATYTAIIAKAAVDPKNWTAAAWWLERRRPQEYARKEKVEMTGKDGGPLEHRDVTELPDHERRALAEAIRSHLRGEEGSTPSPEGSSEG